MFMLNFFRDHSRVITKLYSNQFGASFFAIMMLLASSSNKTLFLATSIFSVLFYLFLNHTVVWEDGAKSRIRVDAGRERFRPVTGLWLGVAAGIPNLLIGVLAVVTAFLADKSGPFQLEWAGNIYGWVNVIARFWEAMYVGIIQYFAQGSRYVLFFLPFPAILGCYLSYWMGLKNYDLFRIFTPKKKPSPGSAPRSGRQQ